VDPGISEFLKIYGPLGIGWLVAGYLIKVFLDRNKEDIESRVKLAVALETLTTWIKDNRHD
jgi:hypothetical protein